MASRNVVQLENRGTLGDTYCPWIHAGFNDQINGEAADGALKKKHIAAEKKNRRALGDIGNLVTVRGVDGKPLPQVSRPVTRSFCAQLLANAQAAADKNNKNSLVNPNGPIENKKAAVVRKPSQKKDVEEADNKPKEIIDISPDTVDKEEKLKEKSAKKRAPTLTATLTARSKAVCGWTNRRKEQIPDIDIEDANNHLAVVEYVEDLYKFYKSAESEGQVHDYIDSQPEINDKMRAILIDWLIQVHEKFDLSPETLYLTINIVDRYLASETTSRRELQLVGLSAVLIASKYEEIWAPEVEDLVSISDRTYSSKQILVMEKQILGALEWYLTVPTPYVFLVRFIKASQTDSDLEKNMVYFLAELGMVNYVTLMYCPSMIAASAVYAARCTLNNAPLWNETLRAHTGFTDSQVLDCAKLLVSFHSTAADQKLKGVYRKYMSSEKGSVALLPPAKSLLASSQ